MIFEELQEFQKDVKQLVKRYRSLEDDLVTIKKVLKIEPDQRPPFSYRIEGLGIQACVIKIKKMACKSLKGRGVNSGLRIVYAFFESDQKIVLIEIFHKNQKENEDRSRILKYFSFPS